MVRSSAFLGWLHTSSPPGSGGEEQTHLEQRDAATLCSCFRQRHRFYPRISYVLAMLSIIHLKTLCFRLPLPDASQQGPNISA